MDLMVENNMFIDGVRILTLFIGSGVVLYVGVFMRRWKDKNLDWGRKFRYIALFGYGILTALQELHALGEPLLIWRLPLLLLCSIFALLGMALPDWNRFWRVRHHPELQHIEWPEDKPYDL